MRSPTALLALALLVGCPKAPPENPNNDLLNEPDAPTVTDVVAEQNVPIEQRINDAVDLLERGGDESVTRAKEILEGVLVEEPDNAVAHLDLGIAHQRLGNMSEARISYQRASDADSENGDAWLYLGLAQMASDREDLGLATIRSGIRRAPDHNGLRAALVQALRESGELDEAIAEAREALKFNSNNLALYNNLGLAYMDKGDLELAKFVFRKGIDGVPEGRNDAWLHTNLGRTFLIENDLTTARFYLEKAVEFDPNGIPGLVYLSQVYLDDRNFADALPLLERAYAADPTNHGVMVNLGVTYRGVERFDDAERLYKAALTEDPANVEPQLNLAILVGDYLKDYERAITLLEGYVERGGDESAAAGEYISDFEKEKRRAARRRQADADAEARDAERLRREELLREAEASAPTAPAGPESPPTETPAPSTP